MLFSRRPTHVPSGDECLTGRPERLFEVPQRHVVLGSALQGPHPDGARVVYLGMGCFWGAEELYWQVPGVISTSVGYQGGTTLNPTYDEVCSGRTGHTEAVEVVYDPAVVDDETIFKVFWENHDPTQGFRQGNDVGTQYRSAIYWTDEAQREAAESTRERYQAALTKAGYGQISTEVLPAEGRTYFYAEDYHQQYLAKNPLGYRCHAKSGVDLPA